MSNGSTLCPSLAVYAISSQILHEHGCARAWSMYAATALRLVSDATKRTVSPFFTIRLDTGSFLSALPEDWMPAMQSLLTLDPEPVSFETTAGSGVGRLARNVLTEFRNAPVKKYSFD